MDENTATLIVAVGAVLAADNIGLHEVRQALRHATYLTRGKASDWLHEQLDDPAKTDAQAVEFAEWFVSDYSEDVGQTATSL